MAVRAETLGVMQVITTMGGKRGVVIDVKNLGGLRCPRVMFVDASGTKYRTLHPNVLVHKEEKK